MQDIGIYKLSLREILRPDSGVITLLAVSSVVVISVVAFKNLVLVASEDGVYDLKGLPFVSIWPFFTKRYDFMMSNFKKTGKKIFRFRLMQHRIVAVAGESARKVFFNEKGLDLEEGYGVLMGGKPKMHDIQVETADMKDLSTVTKQLVHLLRKERLAEILPSLFDDVHRRMEDWGEEGTINPFKEIYELVFQMTIRLASCRELSEDKEAIAQLEKLFWNLEKSATPLALLFPWFPGSAVRAKKDATQKLYNLLAGYVEIRRNAPEPNLDAIDVLIAAGDSTEAIVGFVLGVVFAGFINTGMNVCWNLLYLGNNPEWKSKVALEIQALIETHTDPQSSEPLHKRLSSIPPDTWEDSMPALDAVIRETLRIVTTTTLLRRNLGRDIEIDGASIKTGDFLVYPLADVHHDPGIYPDPLMFDPGRYDEDRAEGKNVNMGFVGWGAGRHPCVGMRVAKLEIKLVLALIISGYDWSMVDAVGNVPSELPQPDRNDIHQSRPIGEPCFLKFRRVVK
ncbi:hypothetical protein H0H81_007074 [Sphagnurus paluster]|uniref:Cytochrome P450 n=1 Tax=Sphagnurus paluster TaxID=117069 RepID=A0A9P7GQZ1_9AGAR|nr:hypothetical protein H0H81_007074 [Sphagnurus paluster]